MGRRHRHTPIDASDLLRDAPSDDLSAVINARGRVVVGPDGHFRFSNTGKRARFWGTNLAFSAAFPSSPDHPPGSGEFPDAQAAQFTVNTAVHKTLWYALLRPLAPPQLHFLPLIQHLQLNWQAVPGATGYRVYRNTADPYFTPTTPWQITSATSQDGESNCGTRGRVCNRSRWATNRRNFGLGRLSNPAGLSPHRSRLACKHK